MSYCPKCREEFQSWVTECLDCKVPLVDILPELPLPEPKPKEESIKEPLVHLVSAPSELMAKMWAGILEDEGIFSFVKGGDWYMRAAIPLLDSNYEIHVVASQVEKAKKILEPFLKDS